jgi:23S rRNA (uracil1939-C5)-methyltransferase
MAGGVDKSGTTRYGSLEVNRKTTITVDIIDLDKTGYGEASVNGLLLKIPGAVTGDRVEAEVVHQSPHTQTAWCRLIGVKRRGSRFNPPGCPHAWPVNGLCGGCPVMHLTRDTASKLKQRQVESALAEYGIRASVEWTPSPKQTGYRNRGQFVISKSKDRIILGAYAHRTHNVVSMTGCRVLRPPMARVATDIARLMTARSVPVFPEAGGVRYVTLRGAENGAVLVDLIVGEEGVMDINALAKQLQASRHVVGVSFSVNGESGNAIRTGPSKLVAGMAHIIESVGELRLSLSASTFSQLNREVMAAMYARAAKLVGEGAKVVWDLYAGVGGLGLTVAKAHPETELLGADSVHESMNLAKQNAASAGIDAHFQWADLALGVPTNWSLPDVVLLNPPRRGADDTVLSRLIEVLPETIIYMSCNPMSFGRDARALIDAGYVMGDVYAYDMLPGTTHVEVIAGFKQRKITSS